MANRQSTIKRETKETNITLELNLDGSGKWEINTGIKMFDHLLSQLAKHGLFDIKLSAVGDDQHHVAEDVAICWVNPWVKLWEKNGVLSAWPASRYLWTILWLW